MVDTLVKADTVKPGVTQRLYWPQLDGLRFFAALWVFIFHSRIPSNVLSPIWNIGWAGVDLFLVLSAFLLTRLIRAEVEAKGKVAIKQFFIRRVLRIWPLHWAFITAMLVLGLHRHPDQIGQSFGIWLSHMAFFNNLLTAKIGYVSLPCSMHLWTISLEEQFYLLVPFVTPILIVYRKDRRALLGLGLALAALIIARTSCTLMSISHPFVWTLPLRMDAMLLGMALGVGVLDGILARLSSLRWFIVGAVLVLVSARWFGGMENNWRQIFAYTVVDVGCLCFICGALKQSLITRFLSLAPLRYLGKISYGLYVYHLFTMEFTYRFLDHVHVDGQWIRFALALALNIGVSSLSYHAYEQWFLGLKRRFTTVESRPV